MPENRRRRTSRRQVRRAIATGAVLALLVGLFSVDYTVERGDTLNKIASDYGVSVADLAEANDIANPNLIRIGQDITVPGSSGSGSGSGGSGSDTDREGQSSGSGTTVRSGDYHIVKRGETLNSIAAKYSGVSAEQIAKANGIVNDVIYVGTRLFLDGSTFVAEGNANGEGTYTVKRGDRLGDIAAAHGTNISTLAELNDITNVNLIRSGQVLTVPGSSAWVCPVDSGAFFNDWGFPRGGGSRFHEGNDIFAKHGTPVHAPVSGVVEQKTGSIGGKQVNLSGNDGVMYLGSHLSEFGESGRVSAGDIIGYVGNTGNAVGTASHLHFGMYVDGKAINPYPTLIENGCK